MGAHIFKALSFRADSTRSQFVMRWPKSALGCKGQVELLVKRYVKRNNRDEALGRREKGNLFSDRSGPFL